MKKKKWKVHKQIGKGSDDNVEWIMWYDVKWTRWYKVKKEQRKGCLKIKNGEKRGKRDDLVASYDMRPKRIAQLSNMT